MKALCTDRAKGDRKRGPRAAAAVELAVVAPVLLTIVFGIIEFGWTLMVRQSLINAAREGCRTASLKYDSTELLEAAVTERIDEVLSSLGLSSAEGGYALEMQHASDPPLPPNDTETVIVSVPYSQVSLLGNFFDLPDIPIQAQSTMRKES